VPWKFDPGNLSLFEKIGGVAVFILFISLFFDWYSFGGGCVTEGTLQVCAPNITEDGLYHGYMFITLLLCLVLIAYYVAKLGWGRLPFNLPFPEAPVILAINALNLLLVIITMLTAPDGFGLSFGAWLGLLAALAACTPSAMPYVEKAQQKTAA
jgi:hypothetical protein